MQQLDDAVAEDENGEFYQLLRGLRKDFAGRKPESELRIIAFIRRERLQMERLAEVIAKVDPVAALNVPSPAAELAHYRNNLKKVE